MNMIPLKSRRPQTIILVLVTFAFFILCQGVQCLGSRRSIDKKLDLLFYNSTQIDGNRFVIVQKILLHLIDNGYLSRNLLFKSTSSRRPIIDFIKVKTIKDAIRKFQLTFRLPTNGTIDTLFNKISVPRCGNEELQNYMKSSNTVYFKRFRRYNTISKDNIFKRNTLTYSILNYPRRMLSKKRVKKIIRRAFNEWARHSDLNFHELQKNTNADFRLKFVSGRHGDIRFDGEGGVLGHAFMPPSGTLQGEVHFDDDEIWTEKIHDGANLLSVACHEIGHALGIHHSKEEKSIMFPVAIGFMRHFALHSDDIAAIQKLYGKPKPGKILPDDEDFYTLPPTQSTPSTTPYKPSDYPDTCNTKIDAILAVTETDLHIFYRQFYWRVFIHRTGNNDEFYKIIETPQPFTRFWRILPNTVKRIDTAFYMDNGYILFVAKDRFWTAYTQNRLMDGVPRDGFPLKNLGLPASVKRVDAIFKWGYVEPWISQPTTDKMKTFLFSGKRFWEYKQPESSDKYGYGKVLTKRFPFEINDTWTGVPNDISTAYTHTNYETYFFKGYNMYRFSNRLMKVEKGYPRHNNVVSWFGCNALK